MSTERHALIRELERIPNQDEMKNLTGVLRDIVNQYITLRSNNKMICNDFEGYARIHKELDLAWMEIRDDGEDPANSILRTASQCARFLVDTCF